MIQALKDIHKNFHAIRIQFFVSLKTTVASTRLGVLWWILDPLILMLLYTFVVKIVFARGGPDYHLFALCGIVTWQSFSRSVSISSTALIRNASLIKQTKLPMHLYVMLPPVVQSFFYLIGLGIVVIWNYHMIGWHTFAVLFLFLPMALIPYSMGLFLSILTAKIGDVGKVVPYILQLGFYLSPVLYPAERVYEHKNLPAIFKAFYALNPMVYIIEAVRDLLLKGKMFDIPNMLIILGATLLLLQSGMLFFRVQSRSVPKEI